jgi:hypothetical protein
VALFGFIVEFLLFHFKTMARSRRTGWISWQAKTNTARAIILEDLLPGGILDGHGDLSAEDVWLFYKDLPEFLNSKVVFDQFKERLVTHRQQAGRDRELAERDMQAMINDRNVYPRSHHNSRGEPVFDLSPAKLLLRQDVIDGRHVNMKPSEFQMTTRPEYRVFDKTIFKKRLYQEIRRKKFLHYLALKRALQNLGPPRTDEQFAARHHPQMDE